MAQSADQPTRFVSVSSLLGPLPRRNHVLGFGVVGHGIQAPEQRSLVVTTNQSLEIMTTSTHTPILTGTPCFAELAFRSGDGIQVSLMWERATNAVIVVVLDRKHDTYFEVPVQPGQRALDVFHHPFAYRDSASTPEPSPPVAPDRG